jgi:hypothetical protein
MFMAKIRKQMNKKPIFTTAEPLALAGTMRADLAASQGW